MKSVRPKYMHIKENVYRRMTEGHISDRVPSENELAREFKVSRMTARKALDALVGDGMVSRIPGKGTFVKQQPVTQAYFHIHAFSENAKRFGACTQSTLIQSALVELPDELNGKLPGKTVVGVRRVHSLNSQPVCFEIRYLRKDLCASLLHEDLEVKSIHRLIVDNLLLPITRVWQRLEAVSLVGTIAEQLGVPANAPAFCMEQLIYSANAPISHVTYYLKSDVYAFEDTFEPGKSMAGGWADNGRFALIK